MMLAIHLGAGRARKAWCLLPHHTQRSGLTEPAGRACPKSPIRPTGTLRSREEAARTVKQRPRLGKYLQPRPPSRPVMGLHSSFPLPLPPQLADQETEAPNWREHQQRTAKHGSLDPSLCPGHSQHKPSSDETAQTPGQPGQRTR